MTEAKTTKNRLPKGWKIFSIEAFNGKRRMGIDFELSGGVSPTEAAKQIVKMVRDFK